MDSRELSSDSHVIPVRVNIRAGLGKSRAMAILISIPVPRLLPYNYSHSALRCIITLRNDITCNNYKINNY